MERSRRDRFSELPARILDMILGFLPIVDAARMAVLSSLWRDSWFSLSNLCFDLHFFEHIGNKYFSYYYDGDIRDKKVIYDNENIDILVSVSLYVITKVLMHHKGPIRKFCFIFCGEEEGTLRSRLFDIDQWLSFVTHKGVEEIHLSFYQEDRFLLPNCIFSCPTLRSLHLCGASYDTTIAPRELTNFTELCFTSVEFEPNGLLRHTIQAPMLEHLSFYACYETMFYFNVNAPKLCTLTIQSCSYDQNIGCLPVNSTFLGSVRTLVWILIRSCRSGIPLQPCELNVECLKLLDDPLHCDTDREWVVYHDISYAFIRLLQICPKLSKLHMHIRVVEVVADCLKRESELSKELYSVSQTLNSLHTLRVSYGGPHYGSREKSLCWFEGFLSCFPTLEKFVIGGGGLNRKNMQKILHFPRASPKVEIVFIK